MHPSDRVTQVLREPGVVHGWSLREWELLVQQARRCGLLPRVAAALQAAQVAVPPGPRRHLDAAHRLAGAQREEVLRELRLLLRSLQPLNVPVLLLKGAAYVAAGLPPAGARLFGDIDVLVPRDRLGEVEARLMTLGWTTTHLSAYDQRYYRRWMHELPPMVHQQRQTTLDIHHNILPLTSRHPPDPTLLLDQARPLGEDLPHARVPAPADMVLHSLVHLLHNEETTHALRDLSDVDLLLRHWGDDTGFWRQLRERARLLGAEVSLADGLWHVHRVFGTPVPASLRLEADVPAPWRTRLRREAWSRAFTPPHPSCSDGRTRAARQLIFLRAHWLRMPPWLLASHLTVKALGLHRPPAAPKAPPPALET